MRKRTHLATPLRKPVRHPIQRVTVDPVVLDTARELADGDARRLVVNLDGSITVLNHPRRRR